MPSSRNMILVTGSSGLIGSAVVERFAEHHQVVGLDLLEPSQLPAFANHLPVDFSSDESVQAGLREVRQRHGERIASVIHLAAYYDFKGEPSPKYEEITVRGTELQRTLGQLIHGEEWETRQIPKAVAKTGAWLQDKLSAGEESFIKPWMIDLADDHYALDISRARALLGWEPKHSLRETLPKMVAALKADPPGWYKANKLELPADFDEKFAQPAGDAHER